MSLDVKILNKILDISKTVYQDQWDLFQICKTG